MIPNIQSALNAILGNIPALKHASGAGRIFELFVMASIARGLQQAGFTVWLQRSDGSIMQRNDADRRFIQRGGSPSGISPASAGRNNPSVIGFQKVGGQAWEIWNGIKFFGRSRATHEIDISIVPSSVGAALRIVGGTPEGRPRIAIECKDVGTAGGLDEMRPFIARLYDMTILYPHPQHTKYRQPRVLYPSSPSGSKHCPTQSYRQENKRTKNIIARRTGFTRGTIPLSAFYFIEPHSNIGVGSSAVHGLVSSVVNWARRNA